MNERILELYKQAHVPNIAIDPSNNMHYQTTSFSAEKFAELIVKECVNVVEGGSFLHDQAPTAIFAKECSAAIKRHFGVEE
jgi:hypothetical protein